MREAHAEPVTVTVDGEIRVSALLELPPRARACYVLAHGAGAGMRHPFMAVAAAELGRRGIASLRYQFPYMERRSKQPDPPGLAHATVRAAIAEAGRLLPQLLLIAGGKSFGGRMTSQAQAAAPLAGVRGLAFLGFPLHPAGRPARDRGAHLLDVHIPMLFLQGSRDTLAALPELEPLIATLGERASLKIIEDADHSFRVPARSGRSDEKVRGEMFDALVAWITRIPKRELCWTCGVRSQPCFRAAFRPPAVLRRRARQPPRAALHRRLEGHEHQANPGSDSGLH